MTEEQLQEIRERAELLTFDSAYVKGDPWKGYEVYNEHNALLIAELSNLHDAEFLAESRQDVPALLAEVERLRKYNEELLTIALWGARRLKAADYQIFTYEWLESLTGKDLSEYKAEVKQR